MILHLTKVSKSVWDAMLFFIHLSVCLVPPGDSAHFGLNNFNLILPLVVVDHLIDQTMA